MNRTSPPRSAQRVRSCEEIPDPVADELRRYDDHLRDIRGLAAGTRHNRCRMVEQLLRKKFATGVVNMATLRPVDIRRFIAQQLGAALRIPPQPKWQRPCQVTSATGLYVATRLSG
ncbi:MAG: hypothetical protein WBM84_16610 [Sedimenticolaceae bacterium]